MNVEAIKEVAGCTTPIRFNVRGVSVATNEDFEPDVIQDYNYKVSMRFSVNQHKVLEQVDGDERLLRYYGSVRINLMPSPDQEDEIDSQDDVKVKIEISFVETYKLSDGCDLPSDDCLQEFGMHNVQYHTWPYLRELMQSYGEKIGLGSIPLPYYLLSKNLGNHKS